jgi:serine/threonine protein kinase
LALSKQEINPSLPEYLPILSGFDYARPDLPDSMTERSSPILEHELYRHPELTSLLSNRSKKSHDIYSLGIVLVEIAFWQPIEDVLLIELDKKGATRRVRQIREHLLSEENGYLTLIDSLVGETYGQVVRRCLVGGLEIGIPRNGDETDPNVGVEMQRVFLEEIVGKLGGVRV